jgi:hypothetical protein
MQAVITPYEEVYKDIQRRQSDRRLLVSSPSFHAPPPRPRPIPSRADIIPVNVKRNFFYCFVIFGVSLVAGISFFPSRLNFAYRGFAFRRIFQGGNPRERRGFSVLEMIQLKGSTITFTRSDRRFKVFKTNVVVSC